MLCVVFICPATAVSRTTVREHINTAPDARLLLAYATTAAGTPTTRAASHVQHDKRLSSCAATHLGLTQSPPPPQTPLLTLHAQTTIWSRLAAFSRAPRSTHDARRELTPPADRACLVTSLCHENTLRPP